MSKLNQEENNETSNLCEHLEDIKKQRFMERGCRRRFTVFSQGQEKCINSGSLWALVNGAVAADPGLQIRGDPVIQTLR